MRHLVLVVVMGIALGGCTSSKQKTADALRAAGSSTRTAVVSIDKATDSVKTASKYLKMATHRTTTSEFPELRKASTALDNSTEHLATARDAVTDIQESVEDAQGHLPNLEDKVDPWEWFFNQLPWIIPTALVLVVGMYFGVGKLVSPVFGAIGSTLEKRLGEMDAKVETGKMTHRESVAAKRAALGKDYEETYKSTKKEVSDV